MQQPRFTLFTTGQVVSGIQPNQVQKNLRAHLKLSEMDISALFSGQRTIIKKGVDEVTAQKYVNQFYKLGFIVEQERLTSD